jgi:2-phospho-L-lactate transferase/gluconeogenesis factor (CofD/UPF0052 family)
VRRKVVLFCGGRGSKTIIEALLKQPGVDLTLIVNAYDDGLSTGALRLVIPGMLGPSDFRKNISYLLDLTIPRNEAVKHLIEHRIETSYFDIDEYWDLVDATGDLKYALVNLLLVCQDYLEQNAPGFDYTDCSVGNLIFAGAYLGSGSSFNRAVEFLTSLFDLRAKLLNVSKGECCVLQGLKMDGTFLPNEAAIVGSQSAVPIAGYYLVENPITPEEMNDLDMYHRLMLLEIRETKVQISLEAEQAILEADMIIYGPGTQHSSLLPSYRIARDALHDSKAPIKAMVINLEHDNDTQYLTADQLIDLSLRCTGGAVTHALFNVPDSRRPNSVQPGSVYNMPVPGAVKIIMGAFDADVIEENFDIPAVHDGKYLVERLFNLPAPLYGYDIDGVLTAGVEPKEPYVVISGRTFAEYDNFVKLLATTAPVYIRGSGAYGDHIAAGHFKAEMINKLGVTEFHEDRPEQIEIIRRESPNCVVISHDVGRPRSV